MKTIEKNNETRFSILPINIKIWLKLVLVAVGFAIWGSEFLLALVVLYLFWGIIKALFSCLLSLVVIVGIFFFLIFLFF